MGGHYPGRPDDDADDGPDEDQHPVDEVGIEGDRFSGAASYNLRMLNNWQSRSGRLPADHPLVIAVDAPSGAAVQGATVDAKAA
jgi:hypothetical protein